MSYAEAIQFLYGLQRFGANFGLETTLRLAARVGNPHEKLRFIHVAGTNGKGSTCAMLESIYRAAGLRVGLYLSPHLVSFRERMQVNRQMVSEADVVRLVGEMCELIGGTSYASPTSDSASSLEVDRGTRVARSSDGMAALQHPTFFEVVTVMALRYFAGQRCDLVVWETGLGGRLDATNIVTPLASVLTNIALDHQQWLGDTMAKIAFEKAGIIKPGVPVIAAADPPEALAVIEQHAHKLAAPLTVVAAPRESVADLSSAATGRVALAGEHQRANAALAVATVRALQEKIPVSDEAIRQGLETVSWPGRLQLVRRGAQTLLLDGAHNPAGAEALCAALKAFPPRPTLVLGVLRDKDWRRICDVLAPLAGRIFLVPVSSERTAAPEELRAACRTAAPAAQARACASLAEALDEAAGDGFVLVTGSLYLVGEAMELLNVGDPFARGERGLNEWTTKK